MRAAAPHRTAAARAQRLQRERERAREELLAIGSETMSRSGSETDDVEHAEDHVHRARTARGLVLSWKQSLFYVPAHAVVAFPKTPFMMKDGTELGNLLSTKDPKKWYDVCKPEHMLMLEGKEGKSCYAIFGVEGAPDEERFIRHILAPICAKNFPKQAEVQADATRGTPTDEHQRSLEILQWRPKDCSANQLDPKHNDWEVCKEDLKSCKIDPAPVPRASSKRSVTTLALRESSTAMNHNHIKWLKSIQVDDAFCEVVRRPNLVTVIQFANTTAPALEDL